MEQDRVFFFDLNHLSQKRKEKGKKKKRETPRGKTSVQVEFFVYITHKFKKMQGETKKQTSSKACVRESSSKKKVVSVFVAVAHRRERAASAVASVAVVGR